MNYETDQEITGEELSVFTTLSVYLTGFTKIELQATGMLESYYHAIRKERDQRNVNAFFREAQFILKDSADEDQTIRAISLRLIAEGVYGNLARRLILLWYTGVWTTLDEASVTQSQMLSVESYKQSLVWKVAETHPAGAKQPGFASWAEPPL